jgi:hypothetical protein
MKAIWLSLITFLILACLFHSALFSDLIAAATLEVVQVPSEPPGMSGQECTQGTLNVTFKPKSYTGEEPEYSAEADTTKSKPDSSETKWGAETAVKDTTKSKPDSSETKWGAEWGAETAVKEPPMPYDKILMTSVREFEIIAITYYSNRRANDISISMNANGGRFNETNNTIVHGTTNASGEFKAVWRPPEDKAVWRPPEDKAVWRPPEDLSQTYTLMIYAFDVSKKDCYVSVEVSIK